MEDKDKKLVSESPEVEVSEEKATPESAIENEKDESDIQPQEEELRDQLLRALADNENIRRRAKKDVQEASQFAITNFARDLLSVADNMNRALTSIPSEALEENEALVAIVNGVEMTARELESTLGKYKIKKIDPLGERFDYNFHQAMFETKDSNKEDGTIVEVLQPGYILGERLLRPAMVGVARSKEDNTNESAHKEEISDNNSNGENISLKTP